MFGLFKKKKANDTFIRKAKKYNEIINVCNYLLSLGITEDGTKKVLKVELKKL